MKFLKMVILMLVLSMLAWAQNPTPDKAAPAQSKTGSS